MQDAVTLANWIASMDSWSVYYHLDPAFKEYRAERYPAVQNEFETSQGFTSILGKVAQLILYRLPARCAQAFVRSKQRHDFMTSDAVLKI